MRLKLIAVYTLGLLALAVQGCGDDGDDNGTPEVRTISYSQDIQPIWNQYCTGCHSASLQLGNLNLEPGASHAQLVNVPSACNPNLRRVDPGNTQGSNLWLTLANDPRNCGGAMPQGTQGLAVIDPPAFQRVEAWIQQGAPNN